MTEKKSGRLILFIIIPSVLMIGSYFFYQKSTQKSSPIIKSHLINKPDFSFSDFVGGWNEIVRKYEISETYLLDSKNNTKTLESFKNYINFYDQTLPNSIKNDLNEITQKYPNSLWGFYRDFLHKNTGNKRLENLNWDSIITSNDLSDVVSKSAAKTGWSETDESIKSILSSNDPCVFFEIHKLDLWDEGLSKNFEKCNSDIVDKKKYPTLADLIRE